MSKTTPASHRWTDWFRDRKVTTAISVQRLQSSRAVGRGVRVAIILPLVMGAFQLADLPRASFLAAFGVLMLLVTADYSGPRRERAASMLITGAAGAVTLAFGAALSSYPVALIAAALLMGTAVTLLGAMRGFLSKAAVPILLPFFLGGTSAQAWSDLPQMELGWITGVLVSTVAGIVMWPYFPRAVLTEAIGDTIAADANAVESFWDLSAEPPAEALDRVEHRAQKVQELYAGQLRRPGSAYRRERALIRLVEEGRRLRVSLRMTFRRLPLTPSDDDRALIRVLAESLRKAAADVVDGISETTSFERLVAARQTHRQATVERVRGMIAVGDAAGVREVATSAFRPRVLALLALSAVRDASTLHGGKDIPHIMLGGQRVPTVVQQAGPWARVRTELSWSAPWMRNALRLGFALALSLAIVRITGVERGYWVVLGTLSVLRLDVSGTGKIAWQVIRGQLLGFVFGFVLILAIGDRGWLPWVLLPVIVGLQGWAVGNVPLMWQQAGFTVLLVTLASISAPQPGIIVLRLEDVALGAAVAVAVSMLVFPRGLVPRVQSGLRAALLASNAFVVASVRALVQRLTGSATPGSAAADHPNPTDHTNPTDLAGVRQAARIAMEHSAETIDLAMAQGQPQGAETALWFRLQNVCEYIGYIAEVIRVVSVAFPHDAQHTRAGADLVVAVESATSRLQRAVSQMMELADQLPADADLPNFGTIGEYSAIIDHAARSVDATCQHWVDNRRTETAELLVELYWTLGWIGEIDLAAANTASSLHELRAAVAN